MIVFNGGVNNIRDIQVLLTRLNSLKVEVAAIKAARKQVIKLNIIQLFNQSKPKKQEQPHESQKHTLADIEAQVLGLKSDLDRYRINIRNSRIKFKEFQVLRKANVPF